MNQICNYNQINKYYETYSNDINKCQAFQQICSEDTDGYFFLNQFYCGYLNQSFLLSFFLLIIVIFQCFYVLSHTAEEYLSPTITYITKKINMSQTLAGVTLLAIGNGCNDVITAVVAGQGEGISFTVGSIFGAGLFVTTVSLARVIKMSNKKPIIPNKSMFLRDSFFFLIAISCIIYFGIVGEVTFKMSCSYLSIYVAYIIVTIIQEKLSQRNTLTLEQSLVEGVESEENQKEVQQLTEIYSKDILTEDSFHDIIESFKSGGIGKYDEITFNSQSNQKQQGNFNKLKVQNFDEIQYQSTKSSLISNEQASNLQDLSNDNEQQQKIQKKWKVNTVKLAHYIKKSMINIGENFKDQGCLGKIILIWQSVSNLFLQITIPPTQENWNKCLTVTSVLFGPLFFIGCKSVIPEEIIDPWGKDVYLIPVALFIGICFASLALKYTEQQKSPKSMGFLSILTFLNSLSWISLAVSILICYLNFLQFITSISKVYLGMTFLALGNSAGDFFTNGQLSKLGYAQMAFTACYAGQLFNLLVGFGMTILTNTFNQNFKFDLFGYHMTSSSSLLDVILGYTIVIISFCNILVMIIYSFVTKFQYDRPMALWLQGFYLIIFFSASCVAIISLIY